MLTRKLFFLILFFLTPFLIPSFVQAAIIYSNSSTGHDTNGDGTLNNPYKTFHKAYSVSSSGDTLNLTGTFTWTDADETGDTTTNGYTLAKSLTIQGQSATSTIVQADSVFNNTDRRIFTASTVGTTIILKDLTIRHGKNGGNMITATAISAQNVNLTMINTILTLNKSSGTYTNGGPALYHSGNSYVFIMRNSTVNDNGNVSEVFGYTGGLHLNSTHASNEITNSTFKNNGGAYYGAVFLQGKVTVTNSTFIGNRGSVSGTDLSPYGSGAIAYVKNNIFAQKAGGASNLVAEASGVFVDGGHNIIETQTTAGFTNGVRGNIVGVQNSLNISSTLEDNSSLHKTPTLALSSGSVAINAGTTTPNNGIEVPLFDQRGFSRSSSVDIGAYEFNGVSSGVNTPTEQASNISTINVQQEDLAISWTNGNGSARTVFMKATNTGSPSPVDNTTYVASSTFGGGSQISSSGWYAVYRNTGTSTVVTGLTPGTTYRVFVVEFNNDSGAEKYFTDESEGNPSNITTTTYSAPSTSASNVSFGNISGKSATITFTGGNGVGRVVFIKSGDGTTASPVNNTTYTASSVFGSGTQIASSGWYAVYKGTGSSVTVSNLSYDTAYQVHVVEYNGSVGNETYQTSSGANNPVTKNIYAGTTIYSNYSTGNDSSGNGTSDLPYKTFHKAYTSAIDGDTLNLNGTFSWNNADETGDLSTSGYNISKMLTIVGQKAGDTIIQAHTADNTASSRIFTISSGYTTNISRVTLRYGKSTLGGCISVSSNANLTIQDSDIFSCRSTSSGGAGIYITSATTTISRTSVRDNVSTTFAGGVYTTGATSAFIATNSTFTNNQTSTSSASYYGGVGYFTAGKAWFTNVTALKNESYQGAITTGGATVYVKNSLIASSTAISSTNVDLHRVSGTLTSGGYNIVGKYNTSNFATTTGDWSDSDGDGLFLLSGGGSGFLSYNTTATLNETLGTYTHALQIGSIGIDQGSDTDHSAGGVTINIPASDQRSVSRVGTPDIGSFEYVLEDAVAPTITLTAPSNGSTIYGSAIGISATATDNEGIAGVKFYVNNVLVGSEDTTYPYSVVWNSLTATSSGIKSVFAVARDTSNNYATSSVATVTLSNQPTPQSISASTATTSATITWATPTEGTSRLFFGFVSALASSTPEFNSGSETTSHQVNLTNLPPCAVFKYSTVSKNIASEYATSSASTLKTAGCTGGATILSNNEDVITTASGGTLVQDALSLAIPSSFTATSSSVTFQANKLDGSTFFNSISGPTGKNRAGNNVFKLSAYTDEVTTLSTFSQPLSVSLTYESSDVIGLDESTLKIHRYDGNNWYELSSCSTNTSTRTITCSTTAFSDFAIFGSPVSVEESSGVSNNINSSLSNGPIFASAISIPQKNISRPQIVYPDGKVVYLDNSLDSAVVEYNLVNKVDDKLKNLYKFNRNLRSGFKGNDVKELQKFLNSNNFTISAKGVGSPGNETEHFGPMTYNALIRFQDAYRKEVLDPVNLSKGSGLFGQSTRSFVNSILKDL